MTPPLAGVRVLDLSTEIAGPYCTKLLADAGADVLKIELPGGDPLRRWTASGNPLAPDEDGVLFRFLNASKRSAVVDYATEQGREDLLRLAAAADLVIDSMQPGRMEALGVGPNAAWTANAALSWVSISPYGRGGPWSNRPATEFTLQASCGSTAARGTTDRPPIAAGGRLGEWLGGAYAAVAALTAYHGARASGRGEHIDLSLFEVMALTMAPNQTVWESLAGQPSPFGRTLEIPSIYEARDGYVGFCTITGQQWRDFLVLIERPDLLDDESLARWDERLRRADGVNGFVRNWTTQRTVTEIVERAAALRVPAGAIGTGETVTRFDHFVARGAFVRHPGANFVQPRPPYRLSDATLRPLAPAPTLCEHRAAWAASDRSQVDSLCTESIDCLEVGGAETIAPSPALSAGEDEGEGSFPADCRNEVGRNASVQDDGPAPAPSPADNAGEGQKRPSLPRNTAERIVSQGEKEQKDALPLAGLRIIDFTAFWAGPFATHYLAAMGADVIKVESIQRPDGMRFQSVRPPTSAQWWEWGALFQGVNLGKRGVTLDLTRPAGVALAQRLLANADVAMENFSPRVLDNLGLVYDELAAANPRLIMVRMPAFGLDGPWRDRVGFAQTMEQISGMAWLTGFADGAPVIPRGPCDPLAGLHALAALLVALEHRRRTGRAQLVEATMIEAAHNAAAEIVLEYGAYGARLMRAGNRGPVGAPQNLYACAQEQWLALAVVTDEHWHALRVAMGDPEWAHDPQLATAAGRRAAHDRIDHAVGTWCADHAADALAEDLVARGIPAARVVSAAALKDNPQLRARGFFETVTHALLGTHEYPTLPLRLASAHAPWYRRPAPTLGEHTEQILRALLGVTDAEVAQLHAEGIIGTRPVRL